MENLITVVSIIKIVLNIMNNTRLTTATIIFIQVMVLVIIMTMILRIMVRNFIKMLNKLSATLIRHMTMLMQVLKMKYTMQILSRELD